MSPFIAFIALVQTGHPHSSATLLSSLRVARPGSSFMVGVHMKMEPTWHTYWKNPGDSGIPISVKWELPEGWKVSEAMWPVPEKLVTGGLTNYAYEHEAMLLFRVSPPRDAQLRQKVALKADVSWLICQAGCVPAEQRVSSILRIGKSEVQNTALLRQFQDAESRLPEQAGKYLKMTAVRDGDSIRLRIEDQGRLGRYVDFFSADGTIDASAPAQGRGDDRAIEMDLKISQFAPKQIPRLKGILIKEGKVLGDGRKAVSVDIPVESTGSLR